ncbi:MAG: FTR1 family protein [Nitrospira sp.]|nr:FTR1 family protein [Nitrospira sp.]
MAGSLLVLAAVVWQAVTFAGTPDPAAKGLSKAAMVMGSAVLVFREGLEAVLVLAAITAGLGRYRSDYWRPILWGIAAATASTVLTWFIAVALISSVNAPELAVQAGTGLVAIVVLLVVMNWFFHKLYWTGWIGHHCKRRKAIFEEPDAPANKVFIGLALLGFTAMYREGFEVVLFLQDLRLKAGTPVVMSGAGVGIVLTAIVAALTFAAHRKLPYKRMLVYTGILLAGVLVVMVGESVQEMQLAGWLPTHPLHIPIPGWMGVWFAAFPNVEGLVSQAMAAGLVLGSFLLVRSKVTRTARNQHSVRALDPEEALQ